MSRYYVRTWDTDKQAYTPQIGVHVGPYSLWGLKRALQKLNGCGYAIYREAWDVLVQDEASYRSDPDGKR